MKKIKKLINELNLDYKKERNIFLLISGILVAIGILLLFFHIIELSLCFLISPFFVAIAMYWRLTSMKDLNGKNHEEEFINLINYLEIYLSNNFNVYNSFLQIKQFATPWMADKIQILLKQIDDDKTVEPFVNFANNFNLPIIENVMVSIFQIMEEGESKNQLTSFDILFQRFSENHHLSNINKKIRKIDSLSTLPLIGAGIVVLILTFGILTIMGDIINVL